MTDNKTKWKIFAAIFLVILILRSPAFWTPILDVDEPQFAGYANVLLSGGLPYVGSVDTKPLGIYYFFAAVFALFGKNNMIAVHVATAVVVALTAFYCYRIANRLYSFRAGIFAALFYAIFTTTYIPKFIATTIVVIMMLPLTMSIYYLLAWEDSGKKRCLWLSGILFGIACCFKYQAGITLFVAASYFLIFSPLYRLKKFSKPELYAFLIFVSGGVTVALLFALHLWLLGVWDQFWFWSVHTSITYVEAGDTAANFPVKLLVRGGTFVASTFLIWYFGVKHSARLIKNIFTPLGHTKYKCEEYLIMLWFLFNFIPVFVGSRLYGHYFIQLLPPLVVLASAEADRFIGWLTQGRVERRHQVAYALFVIGLIVPALGFFGARLMVDQIYKMTGEENPKIYKPIAAYVENSTKPDDKIFVWGFATPIYYYANRDPASRFLWCDWLTGRISGSPTVRDRSFDTSRFVTPGSWNMLFDDLKKNRPAYFIDTSPGNYHDYGKYPIAKYPQLMDYISQNYELETQIDGTVLYRRLN